MFPTNQFVIKKISETETVGDFVVGPLPKGYGSTIGTTFRRILLSSIPGAAITSIKLAGVQHEYTTIAGLQDDVLTIVLALKNLAVVSHAEEPVVLTLKAKGKKGGPVVLTARDISSDPQVEIINPDHVITTLADENAEVDAQITVERGIGYALPDENKRQEIGVVPLDAVFNPVVNVSMGVSHTRVGQQTDLDQLELKILTNGAITPSAAIYEAAEILVKVGEHLLQSGKDNLSEKAIGEVEEAILPVSESDLLPASTPKAPVRISELNLSTRLANALANSGYEDLRDLEGLTEEEVRNIKGMGEKSFQELMDVLQSNDIKLI